MGITVYLPRYRLPGAAPSPVVSWAAPQSVPAVTAPAQETPQIPAPPAMTEAMPQSAFESMPDSMPESPPLHAYGAEPEAMLDAYADAPAVRRAPKIDLAINEPVAREAAPAPVAKPVARAPAAPTEAETRFQAMLLPVSRELAVLTLLPALARQQLQDRERQLLQNILRWLGVAEPNLRGARPFQWPLPNFPGGGLSLAGSSLRAFLDQAQREDKFARVLIFGTLLHEALEADGELRELHATYSLQELVAVPALKRECWRSLMPLHQLLLSARRS
jgi:hypothetical protein